MKTGSHTALVSLGMLCGLGLLLAACPANLDDRCSEGACVARSAFDGAGPDPLDGGFDAPLDPCVNTPTDPKCLDEVTALFVSAAAPPTNADGSRARPFTTIGAALTAVTPTRNRLYVCEGTYTEKVTVNVSASILGGLACDWMRKGANPRLSPPKGVALSILESVGVVITDFDIDGKADPQVPGDSAIAVFVSESNAVLLRRVGLNAGAGTSGKGGGDGVVTPNYSVAIAPTGLSTVNNQGAGAPACGMCVDTNFSTGGAGATVAGTPTQGTAKPTVGGDNAGSSGGMCFPGLPGMNGAAAAAGAGGAATSGTLKATGWEPALVLAQRGVNGNPGQGGGGGGSQGALGGGSGGCGGCGGTGGGAGTSGGSSFALLSFASDIIVEESTLTAAAGGMGATGGKGQDGQIRGTGGGGICMGGGGGNGAGGGGGGGGAGGHSAAVAHTGKVPVTTNCTLNMGLPGGIGAGGTPGASSGNPGMTGLPGARGTAGKTLPL